MIAAVKAQWFRIGLIGMDESLSARLESDGTPPFALSSVILLAQETFLTLWSSYFLIYGEIAGRKLISCSAQGPNT